MNVLTRRLIQVAVIVVAIRSCRVSAQDLSIVQTGPGSLQTSSNATFTLTVTGGSTTNVTLTDVLPSSFTFVSATPPAGGSCSNNCGTVTCTLPSFSGSAVFMIVATATTAGTFTNVAGVVADGYDPSASNNTSTSTVTVTQAPPPSPTSISPNAGALAGSGAATISGTNFRTGATVTVGGANATVNSVTSTTIGITLPAHAAGLTSVVVTNSDLTTATLTNAFTYVAPLTVTGISPVVGPIGGGTSVVVSGTGFAASLVLKLGGTTASVGSFTATSISATSPAHAVGLVNVTVTDAYGQTGTLTGGFTYLNAPGITSVSPNAGPVAGGGTFTITGTNFSTPTVTIGGNPATVNSWTATSIVFVLPAHAAGAVDVVVRNADLQSATLSSGFTYVNPPTISTVTPSAGPANVGTSVTIAGTNLVAGAAVKFGGVSATSVNPLGTTLTCVMPALAAGTVDVLLTTPGGSATKTAPYTYMNPPSLVSLSQTSGPGSGGQSVTVTGTNFVSGMSVSFGGTNGTVTSVPDSAHAVVTTPTHAAGTFSVVGTTPGGSATLTNAYTFIAAPAVTSNAGPPAGSWPVTITGTAFVSGATVKFGLNAATGVTVVNATTISATTPAGSGVVNVIVTNPDAQAGTLVNGFTYRLAPTVTLIAPSSGPANFTQTVTVNGTGFVSGATVKFGTVPATNVTWISASSLQMTAPAQAASTVSVTVTNPGGQAGVLASGYAYLPAPVISSLSPVSGTTAGGDLVTISGSGFAPNATITIGGASRSQVTVVSSTQITFRTVWHAPGVVTVLVSNPGGGTTSPGGTFSYLASPTRLFTITPCRILDTRNPNGPLGGPAMAAGQTRTFTVTGVCGIPSTARTVSANYTVVGPVVLGSMNVFPGGDPAPLASSINFRPGVTRANNGLMTLSWSGNGTISVTNNSGGATHFIIDTNGYFQ
jgi:Domain of unknown function DUF11/IPT/TIG domain